MDAETEAGAGVTTAELAVLVRNTVRDLTGRELTEADFERSLSDLEMDSLIFVDLVCEIEDHLDTEFDDAQLEQIVACTSLAGMIRAYGEVTGR